MLQRLLWLSPQTLPAAVAAAMGAALAVLWLYRSQARLLPPPWTWLVPMLRLAAVGALLVSLLKPSVVRPRSIREQGAVVLLIDRSRSMSVTDPHRAAGPRVALADALGLMPEGTRPPPSADLRLRAGALHPLVDAIAAARSEIDYAQLSGRGAEAAGRRLEDAVGALSSAVAVLNHDAAGRPSALHLAEDCSALNASLERASQSSPQWIQHLRSRADAVINAAGEAQNAADAEVYQTDTSARNAADQLLTQTRLQLVQRALTDSAIGLIANLPPQTPVLAFSAEPGLPPLALSSSRVGVVIAKRDGTGSTDGDGSVDANADSDESLELTADGDRTDLSGTIAALRQKLIGGGVQAVVLLSDGRQVGGSNGPPPVLDVPLFAVGVGAAARRDIGISRFDVPSTVFVGETATAHVELFAAGMKDQPVDVKLEGSADAQTQHLVVNDGRTFLSFPLKFNSAGAQRLAVSIEGLPLDASVGNNSSQRLVKVLADRVAVTVIGGSAGWDYQYLRNALLRTPWIRCHDEIVRPGSATLRMTAEEILQQQILILDDVDPAAISAQQWDAIGRFVSERGGGAIVIAGNDVSPGRLAAQPAMAELLPWRAGQLPTWRVWAGEAPGFRLQPLDASADAVKLVDDVAEDRHRWAELPAMFRILPINAPKPNVRPLLVDRDSGIAVLTEARVGVGRTIFFGATETWRWRYRVGERDQDRFWLQLIREAGEAPYAVHDAAMALDLDNVSVTPDEAVHVRARVLDPQGRPIAGQTPSLRIEQGGSEVMSVPLRPAAFDAQTGRFVATLSGLTTGEYDIRLVVGGADSRLSVPLSVAPNYEAEMADVSGDDANLRRLAEASGGEFVRFDDMRSLPEKLAVVRERRSQSIEYPLWDSPYLFLFVLGCLGSEWALRKRFGLA